jgi:CRISPR-associated protein Csx3
MDISFHITHHPHLGYAIVQIECGIIEPQELATLVPPDPVADGFAHLGVIIKGKMPLWLVAFLTHSFHATRYIAIFDPRYRGAVVVATHTHDQSIGNIIPFIV